MQKPWEIDLSVYEDESQLLKGLRQREPVACTCLLKRYAPLLYRLAWQLLGDGDEAEDALQDAFINACDNVDSFRNESGLGTWLHRIVVNTALMRLRKRKSLKVSREVSEAQTGLSAVTDSDASPDEQVIVAESMQEFNRMIAQLPETLRTAFVLREVEGFSIRECAEVLEIGESAVKVRVHRARLALREQLSLLRASVGNTGGPVE